MDSKSFLKIRQNLVWETSKPQEGHSHQSPIFHFMNSKWILELSCCEKATNFISNIIFTLTLINNDGINTFLPFDVTTRLEDRRNNDQMMCSRIIVSSSREILFNENSTSILSHLLNFKKYDDMTIVCTFSTPLGSVLAVTEKIHKSVQASWESSSQIDRKSVQAPLDSSSQVDSKAVQTSLNFHSHTEIASSIEDNNSLLSYSYIKVLDPSLQCFSKDIYTLLDKNLMPDIKVKCGEKTISAHKAILSARSGVLSDIFSHKSVEKTDKIIEITDIEPHVFEAFLKFLYSGLLPDNLNEDTIFKLYAVGEKYAVYTLKDLCSNYMIQKINLENFSKVLILADMYNDKMLKESVVDFIASSKSMENVQENNIPKMLRNLYNQCNIL